MQGILTPTELDLLCSSYQPTSFALSVLTELVAAAPLRDSQRVRCAALRCAVLLSDTRGQPYVLSCCAVIGVMLF